MNNNKISWHLTTAVVSVWKLFSYQTIHTLSAASAFSRSLSHLTPILQDTGHRIIPVQLSLQILADAAGETERRAIQQLEEPTMLTGHSYGEVIINGGYKNSNVN